MPLPPPPSRQVSAPNGTLYYVEPSPLGDAAAGADMGGAGEEEENIFAVDIVPPGLEHVVEEEEEEEEEEDDDEQVESPGHAQRLGQGLGAALLALRPNRDTGTEQAEEEEEEEEATSPWDRYIAASDETQPESTPGGDEADAKVLRT